MTHAEEIEIPEKLNDAITNLCNATLDFTKEIMNTKADHKSDCQTSVLIFSTSLQVIRDYINKMINHMKLCYEKIQELERYEKNPPE